jgi:hypothetical protein
MTEEKPLMPAERNHVLFSLSFALTHDGRRRYRQADQSMANIVANHLLSHLERSYVIMQKSISHGKGPWRGYGAHHRRSWLGASAGRPEL